MNEALELGTPVIAAGWLRGTIEARAEDYDGWKYRIENRWFPAVMVERLQVV